MLKPKSEVGKVMAVDDEAERVSISASDVVDERLRPGLIKRSNRTTPPRRYKSVIKRFASFFTPEEMSPPLSLNLASST